MPRIRTVKPEFWHDEKLAPLAPIDRLVFLGLIGMADDAGRLLDNVRLIDATMFTFTNDTCADSLETLHRLGRIERGKTASGQQVLQITKWKDHQRVDHPNIKGALPEIVAPVELPAIPELFPTDSRPDLRPTTNDLRPTTNDHSARSAAPTRSRRRKPNWVGQACDDWSAVHGAKSGNAKAGAIGKALKPIVDDVGWHTIRPGWMRYLLEHDPQFQSPANYASRWGDWQPSDAAVEGMRRERTNADGVFVWHTFTAGVWVPDGNLIAADVADRAQAAGHQIGATA